MFHIVLVEPEIPQNAGNIARTCAATGCTLHLVRPLGFEVSDKYLKRAGLDYWHLVNVVYHDSFEELIRENPTAKFYYFTTKARVCYAQAAFRAGDFLVFGKETKGLPEGAGRGAACKAPRRVRADSHDCGEPFAQPFQFSGGCRI